MGPTGTGKSSVRTKTFSKRVPRFIFIDQFVNLVTHSNLSVGDELESCTDSVHFTSPVEIDGKQIIFLDSPGFDDTKTPDSDVLKMIAASLSLL